MDTARKSRDDIRAAEREVSLTSSRYPVAPRSVVALLRPRRS